MIRLVYSGQFRDPSGYGQAALQYLKALDLFCRENPGKLDFRINCVQFAEDVKVSVDDEELISKYEFATIQEREEWVHSGPYIFLAHHTPPSLHTEKSNQPFLARADKIVSMTVWETSNLPQYWKETVKKNRVDAFIVPCAWNEEIFERETDIPTYRLPHVIDLPELISDASIMQSTCTILAVSQWTPRKGWDALIMAYLMEFHSTQDVCLIVKAYRSNSSAEEQQLIKQDIEDLRSRVTVAPLIQSNAKILFIGGMLSAEEMDRLYASADVFALASRGEGFGLPYSEAIARGVPVICPNTGGQVDFVDPENNYLIRGSFEPCHTMGEFYTSDMSWFEPSVSSIRWALRAAYVDYKSGVLQERGQAAREYIAQHGFDSKTIGRKFYEILYNICKGK